MIPPDWTETHVTGPDRPERVYRKHVAGLCLTVDANMIDRNSAKLEDEWENFLRLVLQAT